MPIKPYIVTRVVEDGNVYGLELKEPLCLGAAPPGRRAPGDIILVDADRDVWYGASPDNPLEQHVPITYMFQAHGDDHRLEIYTITLIGPYLPGVNIARALIAKQAGIPEARLHGGSHALMGEVRKLQINSKGYVETSTCLGPAPIEHTAVTRRRLADGARALALPEPTTYDEAQAQIDVVSDGMRALQSLDDLGEEANSKAERDFQTLSIKHATLTAKRNALRK
jgi:hypothetical protein